MVLEDFLVSFLGMSHFQWRLRLVLGRGNFFQQFDIVMFHGPIDSESSTAWEQSCKSPGKMNIAGTLTIWRCISYLNNDHFPWPCYFTSTSVPQEIEKSSVFFSSLDFDSNLGFSDEQGSLDHFTLLDLISHVAMGVILPSCIKII